MTEIMIKQDYIDYFKNTIKGAGKERELLKAYLNEQIDKLEQLTATISQKNFWEIFPEILGVDARLALLVELLLFDDFTNTEIIQMIENDYKSYFKELCGYDLKTKTKPSMIFTII
ncbi:DUF7006 family protein [Enterococcus sp. AZ015]|uniref:DUF7006 family protein n=1 Tax=Enterococcus sp. AZ015 TaxID=2774888 RepID=UPI003D28996E